MTDNEIIIYLVILLVVVLLLYWFSNNIGKHKKNKTKKEIIHNEKIKQQEIIMPQEPVIKTNNLHIAPELENINKTLSIADIIENKIPVAPIIQNEPIIPVEIEQKNLDMEKPIQEIDYNQDNVNSFVIGELTEEETYEEEIKEEENIEPEEQSKSSLAPLLTTALSIPLLKKDKEKDNSENYINYKPKENNVMKVDNSVSLNNEKCAYFQYDLLPDWLKDLMQKENYNLVITNDESLTKDSNGKTNGPLYDFPRRK